MNRTTMMVAMLGVSVAVMTCHILRADDAPPSAERGSSADTNSQASEASRDSAQKSAAQPTLERIRTLTGHDGQVRSVAFAPDGKLAVSAGFDGSVRLWDPESGEEFRQYQKHLFQGQPKPIRKAIFSPDGARILSAGERGMMRSYDVASGEEVVEYLGHNHNIWAAAYAPDGEHVVSGDQNGVVRFWDAQSGELVWQFEQHTEMIYDLRFSPDGRQILSCSKDRSIRLIETSTGDQIRRFDGRDSAILCGAFSPDMKQILTMGYGDEHRVWNLESGEHLRQVTGIKTGIYDVEYLESGLAIAAAADGTLRLIDPETGRQVDSVRAHQGEVWSLAVSPEAPLVLSASADGTVGLWRLASSDTLLRKRDLAAASPSPTPIHSLADSHAFSRKIAKWLREEEFDALEETIAELRESKRSFASGHSRVRGFYSGTTWLDTDKRATGEDYRRQVDLLQKWLEAKPESLAARIALANAWRNYGWHARGGGWAHTVDPKDWERFGQRIQKAQELLWDVTDPQPVDPEYYHTLILLARESGQAKSPVHTLLEQSVAIDPTYWHSFDAAAHYYMPRWHGQPGDVEQLALDGVAMTQEQMGSEVYARVAGAARVYHRGGLFHNMDFDWDLVQQGFVDALDRSPDSLFLLNQYCLLACYAGDRATAVDLFARIRGRWDGSLWGERANFELWRRWASPGHLDGEQQRVLTHHTDGVFAVAFSPDGAWLASGSKDKQLCLIRVDEAAGNPHRMAQLESIYSIAFSPDSRHVATGGRNGQLTLWDVATRRPIAMSEHDGLVEGLTFSLDGRFLASTARSGGAKVWPADSLGTPREFGADLIKRGSMGVGISPDSQHLAAIDGTGQLTVWRLEAGSVKWSRKAHSGYGSDVTFSPDGKTLATASGDKTVKLWNAEDGEPIGTLPAASLSVYDIAFSPDGARIAGVTLSGKDRARAGELVVWDVERQEIIRKYSGHKGGVWCVAISPDGRQIATGSYDMTVRLWKMPPVPKD